MPAELSMQEYDKLMGDGYAKGVSGDTLLMRMRYRTPAAIGKFADIHGLNSRACVAHYTDTGCREVKNYLLFCQTAEKKYKPKSPEAYIIEPLTVEPDNFPLVIEMSDEEAMTI
jgi:hypothetical protein